MTITTQARRERARSDTTSLTNWKLGVARAVVATSLTLLAVALTGLSTDGVVGQVLTLSVFVIGVGLVLGAEFGWNYLHADGRLAMDEATDLRTENAELRANQEEVEGIRRLQQQQADLYKEHLAQLQKQLSVSEAQFKVFRGIAEEESKTGRKVPFEAMMARLELSTNVATGDFSDKPSK